MSWSPFQSQLTILQNAINNWHTLSNNFSDLRAETLSQIGVSRSYVPCVIVAKYVPFRDIFTIIKKGNFFLVSWISVILTVAIIESDMSLHAGE